MKADERRRSNQTAGTVGFAAVQPSVGTKNGTPKSLNRGDAEDAKRTNPKGFRAWLDVDGSWKKNPEL
jgi:hypothetical protein